jgi:hypothetical protein
LALRVSHRHSTKQAFSCFNPVGAIQLSRISTWYFSSAEPDFCYSCTITTGVIYGLADISEIMSVTHEVVG